MRAVSRAKRLAALWLNRGSHRGRLPCAEATWGCGLACFVLGSRARFLVFEAGVFLICCPTFFAVLNLEPTRNRKLSHHGWNESLPRVGAACPRYH